MLVRVTDPGLIDHTLDSFRRSEDRQRAYLSRKGLAGGGGRVALYEEGEVARPWLSSHPCLLKGISKLENHGAGACHRGRGFAKM
eukprot:591560-Alexandrium_andersonii.AAC.1